MKKYTLFIVSLLLLAVSPATAQEKKVRVVHGKPLFYDPEPVKEAKALLDKGVKIEKVNGKDALFSIQPADGSYRVDFGQEQLESYFKAFLRPQLIDMLF